ncbi:hypothetical protein VPNG_00484 [Cytospora leucostoma]|uniref:Uncharacterized protein n=1 Tax=Cytospora leucostoma TaxID=1230097 RepID=A0A423XP35_9PEZI|nr:hypothetical protein VPNG_00484 [Cytospora leucostoma]
MPRLSRVEELPVDPSTGPASAILQRQTTDQPWTEAIPRGDPTDTADNHTTGSSQDAINGTPNTTAIIIAAVVVGVVLLVCIFILLRTLRARYPEAKRLPAPLRKVWQKWNVKTYIPKGQYKRTGDSDDDHPTNQIRMREANLEDALHQTLAQQEAVARGAQATTTTTNTHDDGVNRNTSVRSVMTLPAYRPQATDMEQVLGREGERDGIDTVVEMPTAEEDETMREEEMDALYQIRVARRRQIAEREQRRQERREARERRDFLTLHDVRERARISAEQAQREVEELRTAHEAIKQSRARAVSKVSYHEVGLVRADGTRLRANSGESERMGLLSDAASIALSTQDSHTQQRRRAPSAAPSAHSVISIDTLPSNTPAGTATRSRSGTGHSRQSSSGQLGESLLPRTESALSQRAGSSPELIDPAEAEPGDEDVPPQSPPGYEDVSLEEITPAQSRHSAHSSVPSGTDSPYPEPPPGYPGQARQNRLSAHMAELAEQQRLAEGGHSRSGSGVAGGTPQLPSLNLDALPQIVIEPSSAVPRDEGHEEERR